MWRFSRARDDNRLGAIRLNHLRVNVVHLPITEVRIDREYGMSVRDARAFLEFRGRGRIGDSDHAPPGENDADVGGDRFRSHRKEQRDSLPSMQTERVETVRDPRTQTMQLPVGHLADGVGSLQSEENRGLVRGGVEATLGDVQLRAREPFRVTRICG